MRLLLLCIWMMGVKSVYLLAPHYTIAADDLIFQNETVVNGQTETHYATNTITAGPAYVIESGGNIHFIAGNTITLMPGFHATHGSAFRARAIGVDADPPVIISAYPQNGSLVPTQGNALSMIITFGDANSGIRFIVLRDRSSNDITDQAIINGSSIEYIIDDPADGEHEYTLELEDWAGNVTQHNINFTVDATLPVTTPSIAGGSFENPISVDLVCSEAANIYYSTDGYPPVKDAANTTAAPSPVEDIIIDSPKNLQFFAIDIAGNIEQTKSEIYLVGEIPGVFVQPSAIYNEAEKRIELSWTDLQDIDGYYIYRCISVFDQKILRDSHTGGYPAPLQLRLTQNLITGHSYHDTEIIPGITYWYGVSVVNDWGVEGPVSQLIPITVNVSGTAQNKDEAIERALAWLESVQDAEGHWGDHPNKRILATSQIIQALNLAGKDHIGVHRALFYIRGQLGDNNDYLSRQILSLNAYGQNVDEWVNRLVAQSQMSGLYIMGWGIQSRFLYDAFDTALGSKAIKSSTLPLKDINGEDLIDYTLSVLRYYSSIQSSVSGQYGWIPMKDPDLFVSALVYNVTEAPTADYQWILDTQQPDGSFGSGLTDTAAALLWLDLTTTTRNNAINYIVSQQTENGNWNNDPYLTGLCLEAILK